ncbi:MAG: GNAT family N-acetyltransferase [Caulobacteraceae bacterium]
MNIRDVKASDRPAWGRLWRDYCAFYETVVPDRVTDHTWATIMDAAGPVGALMAEQNGAPIGFANYVTHPYTWSDRPACYLEDLFVDPAARGLGAGRALIEGVKAKAQQLGCGRLYWMTREDNATARKLYDTFAGRDAFVRYVVGI